MKIFKYLKISIIHYQRKKNRKLISELKSYSGKPFPENINNEFLKLAESRLKKRTFDQYFIKNIKKVLFII